MHVLGTSTPRNSRNCLEFVVPMQHFTPSGGQGPDQLQR
jgi:hypothetical protein